MDDSELIDVLVAAAKAVRGALDGLADWGPAGTRAGQYFSDLAADEAAVKILREAGLGVLSEESGTTEGDADLVAVLDPVDGSTNASRGIPWFATSICVLDAEGPRAAVVLNQASGVRYDAVRGGGARRDGGVIRPSTKTSLDQSLVALSGYPEEHLGWRQFRALGAAALDLCAVADGTVDAYVDCSVDAHGPWDYLGGLLVCTEAGAAVADVHSRPLAVRDHSGRRTPVAAATPELLDHVLAARRRIS